MQVSETSRLGSALEATTVDLYRERHNGVIRFLEGRRGSGKTNLSLLTMEILNDFHIVSMFATNIKINESPFEIERITNMEDLNNWLKSSSHRKFFSLDEAGKAIRRRTPMSGLNISILDMIQVIRHHEAHLDYIAPNEGFIDSAMLSSDILDVRIRKPDWRNPKVGIWFDILDETRIDLHNIPRTIINYDDHDIAPFTRQGQTKIRFSDTDRQLLWDWSHDLLGSNVGTNQHVKLSRIRKRFIKEALEKEANALQQIA